MKSIPLFQVVNDASIENATLEVMRTGAIAGGPYVAQFEQGLSSLLDADHVVTVSDMTSAIYMILHMVGVRRGDEVLTTSFSCMASHAPIAAIGAHPVWVDVQKDSVFMSIESFEKSITKKTKLAIFYHVAGYPGPIREVAEICKKRGIVLLEDCNNALLAEVNGMQVGSFGDFSVFSFYPTRLLQTFEGAAVVCRKEEDAQYIRKIRRLGIDFSTFRNADGEIDPASDIRHAGWASSLSNLNAAVGCAQLSGVGEKLNLIRSNVACLSAYLESVEGVTVIPSYKHTSPSYWAMLLLVENRDMVLRYMKAHGVHVSSLHQANHVYSCFQQKECSYIPNSCDLQKKILAIPCGWWLSREDLDAVVRVLIAALKT